MNPPIIISEGTIRIQDVLPAFLEALNEYAPAHYEQLLVPPSFDDDPWWNSEEAYDELAEIIGLLNEYAPEGTYFGSHEGDGACFGFWSIENEEGAA